MCSGGILFGNISDSSSVSFRLLGVESSSCNFESTINHPYIDDNDRSNMTNALTGNDHEEHQDNSLFPQPNNSNSFQDFNHHIHEGSIFPNNRISVSVASSTPVPSSTSVYELDYTGKTSLQEQHNPNQSAFLADPHHPQNRLPPFYYYKDKGTLVLVIRDEVHKIVVEYNGVRKEMSVDTKERIKWLDCEEEFIIDYYRRHGHGVTDIDLAKVLYNTMYLEKTEDSTILSMRDDLKEARDGKKEKKEAEKTNARSNKNKKKKAEKTNARTEKKEKENAKKAYERNEDKVYNKINSLKRTGRFNDEN